MWIMGNFEVGIDRPPDAKKKEIIPALIGAAGAIGGALLANKSSEDINEQNVALTREGWERQEKENALNRQFQADEWTRQFNLQNGYNDPANILKRLENAGINAKNVFGSGTDTTAMSQGSPSAPSGAVASHAAPIPMGLSGSPALQSVGAFVNNLADAANKLSEQPYVADKAAAEIQKILASASSDDARARLESIQSKYEDIFGEDMRRSDIQKMLSQTALNYAHVEEAIANGDYIRANELLSIAKADTERQNKRLHGLQADRFEIELAYLPMQYTQQIRLLEEQQKTERARQSESYAHAGLFSAQSITENQLRKYRVEQSRIDNQISSLERDIKSNDADVSDITFWARVDAVLKQYYKCGLDVEKIEAEIDKIKAEKDATRLHSIVELLRMPAENMRDYSQSQRNVIEPITKLAPWVR